MNNPFDPMHIQEEKAEREARRLKLRSNLLITLFCGVLAGFFVGQALLGTWGPSLAGMALIPSIVGAVIVVAVVSFFLSRMNH